MLDTCCGGISSYRIKEGIHNDTVYFNGKTFPSLPKGEHKGKKHEIQVGHVRSLAIALGIRDCAAREIPMIKVGGLDVPVEAPAPPFRRDVLDPFWHWHAGCPSWPKGPFEEAFAMPDGDGLPCPDCERAIPKPAA